MPFSFGAQDGVLGDRYTGGQSTRLAQILSQNNMNNGTRGGGMATILQKIMEGMSMSQGAEEQAAAKEQQASSGRNLADALRVGNGQAAETKTYPNTPDDNGAPTVINWNPVKPDQGAMMQKLASDPINGRLAALLMLTKATKEDVPEKMGQPTGVIGPDGKPALIQAGDRGTIKNIEGGFIPGPGSSNTPAPILNFGYRQQLVAQHGEGSPDVNRFDSYVRQIVQANLGDRVAVLNPSDPGHPTAELPKGVPPQDQPKLKGEQARETGAGHIQGETQANAAINLPQAQQQGNYMLDLLDKVATPNPSQPSGYDTHPGFSTTVGAPGPTGIFAKMGMPIPGTDAADFSSLMDQIKGKQFLEAFNGLRGGGAITEVEGKKATDAIARMNTAQSEKAFLDAQNEFRMIVKQGMDRARTKAGGSAPGAAATPAAGGIKFLGFE